MKVNIKEKDSIQKESIYNIKENINSFNQLQILQLLIQKHSGLKELCKFFLFNLF